MVAVFVRLKLSLIRNGLRGSWARRFVFWAALPPGLALTVAGWLVLRASRHFPLDDAAMGTTVFATVLLLGWVMSPLYLFASDNILDPARLVLLPLRARDLMVGMTAAAFVGIPPVATAITLSGTVIGLGRTPAGVAAATCGAVLVAALCVFTSRAVATALAGVLRSRRGRDLGTALMTVTVGSFTLLCGGLQALFSDPARLRAIAAVCRWTPPGLAISAGADASAGRWSLLALDLGGATVALLLVLLWWSRTLASALVTPGSSGPVRRSSGTRSLFPRGLGLVLPRTRMGAVLARELRYAWRSPYKRSSLLVAIVAGSVMALAPAFFGLGLTTSAVYVGCVIAAVHTASSANTLGYEGRSLWLHHVAPGSTRPDWAGRIAAHAAVGGVPSFAASTIAAAVTGSWLELPAALGLCAVTLAAGCGVGAVFSVVFPYAMPDVDANPFSSGAGGGFRALLATFGSYVVTAALSAPVAVLVVAGMLGWQPGLGLACPVGFGYAALLVGAAAWVASALHDRRAPELWSVVAASA